MPTDPLSIREAWSKIPSPGSVETEFERFTGKRMERILATVVAIGSGILGAQALIAGITTMAWADAARIAMLLVVFIPLVVMLVACVIGRGVRTASGAFAIVYTAALAAWPSFVDPVGKAADQPWIFFLVNVGVVAAMLAFPLWLPFAWAVCLPFVYGYVRL
ncbi:ATP-binding protein, partial [Microbacterium sp. ISL-103]|nr:ATP-binding protein [Microbacterium sp. ISL-103]